MASSAGLLLCRDRKVSTLMRLRLFCNLKHMQAGAKRWQNREIEGALLDSINLLSSAQSSRL